MEKPQILVEHFIQYNLKRMNVSSPSTAYSGESPRPSLSPLSDAASKEEETASKSGSDIIEEAFGGERKL